MEVKGHLLRSGCRSTIMNFDALLGFFLQTSLFIDFSLFILKIWLFSENIFQQCFYL